MNILTKAKQGITMMHGSTEVAEDKHADRIIDFLKKIGIEVREGSRSKKAFMPGIWVDGGAIVVDRQALLYPGDLLHEAGHLAVMPPDCRSKATGSVGSNLGEEIAAQAWSYAAALAADIPLEVVFHNNGYHGAGPWLRKLFAGGGTAGVPLLVWYGMTQMPGAETGGDVVTFPRLSAWLRTTPHPPYPPMPADIGPC